MLEVTGVSHVYPGGGREVLRGVGFRVGEGEIVGIVGPAGAGKSTLARVLTGLIRGYAGEVIFEGRELKDWSREFFEHIGVCLERPGHFDHLSAAENLAYFAALYAGANAEAKEPLPRLLEKVGLASEAGTRVGRFSGEMKKRLGLARALLHGPRLLVLDDPLAGVAPAQAAALRDLLREQKKSGRTVIFFTENAADAEDVCDRVAVLTEGRLSDGGGRA